MLSKRIPSRFRKRAFRGVQNFLRQEYYNRGEGSDDDGYYSGDGLRVIAALLEQQAGFERADRFVLAQV